MEIIFLESFYGGSHRDVADNIVRHSRHAVELHTLPARFWKWRMRGAALHFAREAGSLPDCDLLICTGLMNLADLTSLVRDRLPPILLYAHETQLSYPAPSARESDLHFAFTDLVNMLTADHVAFNSRTHRRAYLDALPGFLRRLPEYRPMWAIDEIERKSSVCYPGITWEPEPDASAGDGGHSDETAGGRPPLILWNHRWEFDKNPDAFFAALREVRRRGCAFRLALLGENFQVVPKPFLAAREEFAEQIVRFGYLPNRAEYREWLRKADIVISTSIQENFGISVMEAVAHGALPLLPRRLSYLEIIPSEHHTMLYTSDEELVDKLEALLPRVNGPARDTPRRAPPDLVRHARSFAWREQIEHFDELFDRVAADRRQERTNG